MTEADKFVADYTAKYPFPNSPELFKLHLAQAWLIGKQAGHVEMSNIYNPVFNREVHPFVIDPFFSGCHVCGCKRPASDPIHDWLNPESQPRPQSNGTSSTCGPQPGPLAET